MPDVDVVPVPQLITAAHWGGIVLVAEDQHAVIGFSYGFPGRDGDEPLLCSHMLGVVPAYRDRGVGYQLKIAQRSEALRRGLNRIVWTFDPLEARNAHLNLHKLGARVTRYLPDHYGTMSDSLNQGLPSDRLLADWRANARPAPASGPAEVVNPPAGRNGMPAPGRLRRDRIGRMRTLLLAVPRSIDQIKRREPGLALEWRLHVREAFQALLAAGYTAADLASSNAAPCYVFCQEELQ